MTKFTMEAGELLTRRSPQRFAPTSWNADERTLHAVIAAGAGVDRWDARGPFTEFLDPAGMEPADRVPVLNSHQRSDLSDVLGSVLSTKLIDGRIEAMLKLSRRSDVEPVVQDILDGHITGTSVGYRVLAWKETTDPKSGVRSKTATRWTLVEVSLVPVPADPNATIRGGTMPTINDPVEAPEDTTTTIETTIVEPGVAERAASDIEVRSIARASGLGQDWVQDQIDAGATVEFARAAALSAMRSRTAISESIRPQAVVTHDNNDPAIRIRAVSEALFARSAPSHTPSEQARPYIGMSIPDIARDSLRSSGATLTGLGAAEIVTRALHTTSDFPLILGSTVNRTLRAAYDAAPSGVRQVARQTTARDFRAKHSLQLSSGPELKKVSEAGEFTSGTMEEAGEAYRLETFGRIIGLSRQALVNDDLGAFSDLSRRFGAAAAAFEAAHLVGLLTQGGGAGPVMGDGKTLFHVDHRNVAASGSALSLTSLSAARLALRQQTGLVNELISVTPKYLVVSAELETDAEAILTTISATKADDVNPFASKLVLVVEPRLVGKVWYVVADPVEIDGLEYAYLEGEPGPQIETKAGFEIDGVQVKVRLDFGAGFVEHRSWYRNPGAA